MICALGGLSRSCRLEAPLKSAIPALWCAWLGIGAALLAALAQFTDVVGSEMTSIAFVLALMAALGAISGSVSDTRPRSTRAGRQDARLRMVGLGGAGAALVLCVFALAG